MADMTVEEALAYSDGTLAPASSYHFTVCHRHLRALAAEMRRVQQERASLAERAFREGYDKGLRDGSMERPDHDWQWANSAIRREVEATPPK